ncbi:MAG: MerR family transcriptional regulator, partial [Chloroflexi bacterium]|nr:MerR family transcriptional regulator [Chloroflexota bacterium]
MNDRPGAGMPHRTERTVKFTISVAAEMVNVHAQTLRHYERIGLIAPKRSEGKIRYYTLEDIELLDTIKDLIEDRKVNLAGVQAILDLREQMEEMRAEAEREIDELRVRYEGEIARLKG